MRCSDWSYQVKLSGNSSWQEKDVRINVRFRSPCQRVSVATTFMVTICERETTMISQVRVRCEITFLLPFFHCESWSESVMSYEQDRVHCLADWLIVVCHSEGTRTCRQCVCVCVPTSRRDCEVTTDMTRTLVEGCSHESVKKTNFVDHLSIEHINSPWTAHLDTRSHRTRSSHSIIVTFLFPLTPSGGQQNVSTQSCSKLSMSWWKVALGASARI